MGGVIGARPSSRPHCGAGSAELASPAPASPSALRTAPHGGWLRLRLRRGGSSEPSAAARRAAAHSCRGRAPLGLELAPSRRAHSRRAHSRHRDPLAAVSSPRSSRRWFAPPGRRAGRYSGDRGEIEGRYSGDRGEIEGRYSGDTGEMQAPLSRRAGKTSSCAPSGPRVRHVRCRARALPVLPRACRRAPRVWCPAGHPNPGRAP